MPTDQLQNEIRDTNLSYLLLAQAMIRKDKAQALFRLGLSPEVADIINQMSAQQMIKIAGRNQMMCTIRFDDELIWGLLTERHGAGGTDQTADKLHASVLMAGKRPVLA